jgi:hypothetical protein
MIMKKSWEGKKQGKIEIGKEWNKEERARNAIQCNDEKKCIENERESEF